MTTLGDLACIAERMEWLLMQGQEEAALSCAAPLLAAVLHPRAFERPPPNLPVPSLLQGLAVGLGAAATARDPDERARIASTLDRTCERNGVLS